MAIASKAGIPYTTGMLYLTANLAGKSRRELLHGREHIVVPMTLIVPGVLNGSKGSLFYPPEEIAAHPTVWNHIPIVVRHPDADGEYVSARDPSVLNAQGVGVILNAHISEQGKLKAEGWFDIESTRRIDSRILTSLATGNAVELSTGLFTENEEAPEASEFNGVPYTATARNYRPDHLAALPDEVGACSLADGCGINVNSNPLKEKQMTDDQKTGVVDFIIANCEYCSEEDRVTLNSLSDEQLAARKTALDKAANDAAVANAATEGFTDPGGNEHTWNATTSAWETKAKKVAPPAPVAPVVPVANVEKPKTEEEWMASAPPKIRSAIENAQAIEARERGELIERITSNVENAEQKLAASVPLQTMPLDQLRSLAVLAPKAQTPVQPAPNFAGSAAPIGNVGARKFDKDDTLPLPAMDYSDLQQKTG